MRNDLKVVKISLQINLKKGRNMRIIALRFC